MSAVRVGVVGAGWIGAEHVRVLTAIPEVELVAVCDIERERAAAVAAGTAAAVFTDWHDLLEREDLSALVVCTPPMAHREVALAAMGRGLPLYLEKPIARGLDDAAAIVDAAKEHHALCAIGYQWHALELLEDLRALVPSSEIGAIVGTSIGPTESRPWFIDRKSGGGNILERGSHQIDLVRTVGGEVASVQAGASSVRLARSDQGGGDIDDAVTLLLELTSGALATIVVAWTKPGQPGTYGLQVAAADATLRLDLDPDFTLRGLCRGEQVDKTARMHPFERSMRRFLEAVSSNDPDAVFCVPSDAARTLAVAIAVEQALETGERTPVELV